MASGRFAPSPTGPLHFGNLRTALVAWLFARSAGSRFTMRIEDLDRERSRPEFEARQLEDLAAIGLDWDGPVVHQSARSELYREALETLHAAGKVYPCWCTRAEIRAATSAPHAPIGAYPGTCRGLAAAQRTERERQAGRPPSLRLDAGGAEIAFEDRLRGTVEGPVDDFVLRRWDGSFAYNLAVVVDDADQGIEEVVRGDDLLDTTARQLLLYRLLDLPTPAHAHVPLVLGRDGERLAKRHGAVTLEQLTALGRSPREVLAEMASGLGLAQPGEGITPRDLCDRFDPARLPREPLVFDWPGRAGQPPTGRRKVAETGPADPGSA